MSKCEISFFLVINISVTLSGSSAVVCMWRERVLLVSLGMPQNTLHQKISPGGSNFMLVRPT